MKYDESNNMDHTNSTTTHVDPISRANEILTNLPGRRTRGRTSVLASLIEARDALTHTEIEMKLPPEIALDRVTLYRILDWLVEHSVVHRVSGADRAVRYAFTQPRAATTDGGVRTHAHFQCETCGRVGCLDDAESLSPNVPVGLKINHVNVLVHVSCLKTNCEFAK